MAERTLEPLITECPSCRTRFRVSEAQLSMAQGRVRCGACLSVFTATDNLVIGLGPPAPAKAAPSELDELLDELANETVKQRNEGAAPAPERRREAPRPPPSQRADEITVAEDSVAIDDAAPAAGPTIAADSDRGDLPSDVDGETPAEVDADAEVQAEPAAADEPEPAPAAEPTAEPEARADAQPETAEVEEIVIAAPVGGGNDSAPTVAPRSSREQRAAERAGAGRAEGRLPSFELPLEPSLLELPRKKRRWWLLPATMVAAAVLGAQVLWFQFDAWSRDLRYRPIYEFVCPYLDCKLPVMRAIASIRSRNLVVRSHPEVPNALVVDALLINEAPFPQPFPLVELRFSSMTGALVAGRRFQPSEYLAGELSGATMMKPNTPVHIAFEIEDPGTDAVNYVMVFR